MTQVHEIKQPTFIVIHRWSDCSEGNHDEETIAAGETGLSTCRYTAHHGETEECDDCAYWTDHGEDSEGAGCLCPICICPHAVGGDSSWSGVCCGCDGGDKCPDGYYRTREEVMAYLYA